MSKELKPARELAAASKYRFPNESEAYRKARTALLAEEIELRRHIERVAEQRRALPPGGEVSANYRFVDGAGRAVGLLDLFAGKQTLAVYSYMFGPERERPCPMCTSLLSAWDGETHEIEQRIGLAVVTRSPIERLAAFKKERGWRHLTLYSDADGAYFRDYRALTEDGEIAAFNVFTRRDGKIRHFWAEEMGFETADPGQDPRGVPDLMPLWTVLDATPEGRAPDWYPQLDYARD